MNQKLYLITGANGHLGNTIIRLLQQENCQIRGLILPNETPSNQFDNTTYFHGDVSKKETLLPLFEDMNPEQTVLIHTAGIIDISEEVSPALYNVNVTGTKNIAELALQYKLKRMVYVSSVHAIPEGGTLKVLKEISHFSKDNVVGGYAKTKAEATQAVLDLVPKGLPAIVVHPSGILGPYDNSGNHLVQLVHDYILGKLPACVHGGYDFVDVRDVAQGCLLAAQKGTVGECYILSNRHYEIKDLLKMAQKIYGGKHLPILPIWMAKLFVPLIEWVAKQKKRRPLYTKYSLYTLKSNDKFFHDKATSELGYRPRDLFQTISDTISWMKQNGQLKKKKHVTA